MTPSQIIVISLLAIAGFIVGFTHERKHSFSDGIHGGCVCIIIGSISVFINWIIS